MGYYSKARSLANQPDAICCGVIQKITIPIFSNYQYDYRLLLEKYRQAIKMIYLIMGLVTAVLLSIASPLIVLLWTDKWMGSVFPFQMLLIASLFSPASTLNLSLLQVINHTGYSLKLELIKKPIFLILILVGSYFELPGLLYAQIVISVLAVVVNMKATQKYLSYNYSQQFCDVIFYILAVAIASSLGYFSLRISSSIMIQLPVAVITTFIAYISFLAMTKEQMLVVGYNKVRKYFDKQ